MDNYYYFYGAATLIDLVLLDNTLPFKAVLYSFISLSFLCRESLACQIFRDEVAGLMFNPRYTWRT